MATYVFVTVCVCLVCVFVACVCVHVCICVCSACFADITNHVTLSLLATCNLRRLLDVCKSNKAGRGEGRGEVLYRVRNDWVELCSCHSHSSFHEGNAVDGRMCDDFSSFKNKANGAKCI